MKAVIFCSVALFVFLQNSVVFAKHDEYIISGTAVTNRSEITAMVTLLEDNIFLCGGVIITPLYVLTAANCVKEVAIESLSILSGHLLLNDTDSTITNVLNITIHESFDPKTLQDNVALIKINGSFSADSMDAPITAIRERPADATECVVYGFGVSDIDINLTSNELLKTTVTIVNDVDCRNDTTLEYTEGMICANGTSGVCFGDDGGPLVCDNELAGIVSAGSNGGCGELSGYQLYTKYAEWINTKITPTDPEPSSANIPRGYTFFIALFVLFATVLSI